MSDEHRGETNRSDEMRHRRRRRAELLLQRERAARSRRERGLRLRLPSTQPLILPSSRRAYLR